MYEFVKIEYPRGEVNWLFHPHNLIDVYAFMDKVIMAELKSAIVERAAHTFVGEDGSLKCCYHPQTAIGQAVTTLHGITYMYTGKVWEKMCSELVNNDIHTRIEKIMDGSSQLFFHNGITWFPTTNPDDLNIVDSVTRDRFEFPGGPKLRPADIRFECGNGQCLTSIEHDDIFFNCGVTKSKYEGYRNAERKIKEVNAEAARAIGVTSI